MQIYTKTMKFPSLLAIFSQIFKPIIYTRARNIQFSPQKSLTPSL